MKHKRKQQARGIPTISTALFEGCTDPQPIMCFKDLKPDPERYLQWKVWLAERQAWDKRVQVDKP